MKNIIVTDQVDRWSFLGDQVEVISTSDYLTRSEIESDRPIRIINLCRNYKYQAEGYYVSLLAEARGHKIIPSVMAIQDIHAGTSRAIVDATIQDDIQTAFKDINPRELVLDVYFGKNEDKKLSNLCAKLHSLFPIPLFQVTFTLKKEWLIQKIQALSIDDIPDDRKAFFLESATDYFARKRFCFSRIKNYLFDIAMLVNDQDKTSPSESGALERFVHAGEKLGIYVQPVKKEEIRSLSEYDGLFIRETTSILHWTYKLARKAQAEGMIVIDDPQSILRCTNKVYLAELLKNNKLPIPETTILHRNAANEQIPKMEYPCVLKRPDGSSSRGLTLVHDADELTHFSNHYFKDSDLIIAQSFLPTEFDWRIGIFDNKPIFACKYFMVKNHWQIHLWEEEDFEFGNTQSIDIAKVPPAVIQAALKAASLIGNSLYGVDLKQIGDKVYIIEINDNPNIDHDCEDKISGDKLYTNFMQVFLQRLKMRTEHAA